MRRRKGATRSEEESGPLRAIKMHPEGRRTADVRASVASVGVELEPPRKLTGTCPVCGKLKLFADWRGRRWAVGCWVCCPPGASDEDAREYLHALKEHTGARGDQILTDAPRHLAQYLNEPAPRRNARRLPPLSEAAVQGWQSRLRSTEAALAWLADERGLTVKTVERYELGYDGEADAITIPIRDNRGELVNVKYRFLSPATPDDAKRGLARPAALFPAAVLAERPDALVLCEGELDALLLNQHGITAVTSTSGTTGWRKHPEWSRQFVGARVAVMYDAGAMSYELAERRALALVAAGAREAWPVDLTLTNFSKGEDVGDWFCTYGWCADDLRAFLNATCHWYREERAAA